MATFPARGGRPTLLDRLVAATAGDAVPRAATSVARLLRDVEELLNTWTATPQELSQFGEASTSLLTYGSRPPQTLTIGTYEDKLAVAEALEAVITRFEPRLAQVRVRVLGGAESVTGGCFAIDARLRDDLGSNVSADVELDPGQGHFHVAMSP